MSEKKIGETFISDGKKYEVVPFVSCDDCAFFFNPWSKMECKKPIWIGTCVGCIREDKQTVSYKLISNE